MKKNIWNTPVEWQGLSARKGYDQKFLLCGSCFADRVGQKLQRSRFHATVNPCGIAFDPLSLARHAEHSLQQLKPNANDIIHHDGLWHSMQFHGSFSYADQQETLRKINIAMDTLRHALQTADVIVFTFGSAWYLQHRENQQPITNAHKLPSEHFRKKLATVEQITEGLSTLIALIHEQNSTAEVIISVSPVRYLRDGIEGNMRSKARLIESAHQLRESNQQVHYFPAYEMVMDELRDYRWYAEDMLHISQVAVDHIWEKFRQGTFHNECITMMDRIEPLIQFIEHRPIHNSAEDHAKQCSLKEQEIQDLLTTRN